MIHAPFLRTKVARINIQFDILILNNIFKFEVLKFLFDVRKKAMLNCFNQYFQLVVQAHNYPIRFAVNNLAVSKLTQLTKFLLNDQYDILEVNFGMKCLNILEVVFISVTTHLYIE